MDEVEDISADVRHCRNAHLIETDDDTAAVVAAVQVHSCVCKLPTVGTGSVRLTSVASGALDE